MRIDLMIPAILSSIYFIGLLATFLYLSVSLRAMSTSPKVHWAQIRANWLPNFIASAVWFILLPFLFIYELVKRLGRLLRVYKGV